MITRDQFFELALSFQGAETMPHFNRTGFKVAGKRMFATYLSEDNTANIFLTPAEQAVFRKMDKSGIYPVPNKWGLKGATTFQLDTVAKHVLQEALFSAYTAVLKAGKPKK